MRIAPTLALAGTAVAVKLVALEARMDLARGTIFERQTICRPVPVPPAVTCERSCGPGFITCVSLPTCYNPSRGDQCCSNGKYCPAGSYCSDIGCCPDGVSLEECGATTTLSVIPPPAPEPTDKPEPSPTPDVPEPEPTPPYSEDPEPTLSEETYPPVESSSTEYPEPEPTPPASSSEYPPPSSSDYPLPSSSEYPPLPTYDEPPVESSVPVHPIPSYTPPPPPPPPVPSPPTNGTGVKPPPPAESDPVAGAVKTAGHGFAAAIGVLGALLLL